MNAINRNNVVKVTTKNFIAWVCEGTVNLAKCATTGKFVKLATVQYVVNNILAIKASAKNAIQECGMNAELVEQMGVTLAKMNGTRISTAYFFDALVGVPSVFDKRTFW